MSGGDDLQGIAVIYFAEICSKRVQVPFAASRIREIFRIRKKCTSRSRIKQ
jgi:hypothetical protein